MRTVALCFLACLLTFASACPAAQDAVIPYPRVPGDDANADFPTVKVNGMPVETCGTVMNVGYAHFAFTGTAKVEITARESIKSFDVSPHRDGVAAKAQDNTLSFELSQPRKLQLQVNSLSRFFLFANGP